MPSGINCLLPPQLPHHSNYSVIPIQVELFKDTAANHPPSDCPDPPRRRHHLPVVLRPCCLEQRCPIPLRAEHDCMLGCLAPSPTVTSRVVEPWDPPLMKECF